LKKPRNPYGSGLSERFARKNWRKSGIAGKTVFVIDPTSALARKVVKTAEESFARTGVR